MSKKMIVLKSSDGKFFEIDETIALQSETIAQQVKEDSAKNEISLPEVTSKILEIVIEYCKKHVAADVVGVSDEDLKDWDADFMKKFTDDKSTLFHMVMAANYLSIKNLLDLTSQTVADMITDKNPEEIREFFGIENDFNPEEEEANRRENAWANESVLDITPEEEEEANSSYAAFFHQ